MNRRKNLFAVVSALVASSTVGHGEISMTFTTGRAYRQSPTEVAYRRLPPTVAGDPGSFGGFRIRIYDGNWFYGCGPSLTYFPPSVIPPCPLGATGYLAGGDANNDGVRDDFLYYEVTAVVPAIGIEPNRPDLCELESAPPSIMPRPLGLFTDMTDTLFYDIQTDAVTMYKLPDYFLTRTYDTRGQADAEAVLGRYLFKFPRLGAPDLPVSIPVEHYPIPEGYIKKNNVRQGFRFTKLNGKGLIWDAAGFVGVDPRIPNIFEWAGNSENLIFPLADNLYVAIANMTAAPVGDPTRAIADPTVSTLYPGFFVTDASVSRVLLSSPLETQVIVPPGFVNPPIANPPREAMLRVMLNRSAATSSVASDTSFRAYELPIRFIDTYEGWAAVTFPAGTPTSLRAPGIDKDGDGFTNLQEWLANPHTNPNLATSKPPAPVLAFVQDRPVRSTENVTSGHWEVKHAKNVTAWPAMSYEFEYSTDLKNWTVIGNDDPDWAIINEEPVAGQDAPVHIIARSKHEKLTGNGFLRVKSTQAPEPPPQSEL